MEPEKDRLRVIAIVEKDECFARIAWGDRRQDFSGRDAKLRGFTLLRITANVEMEARIIEHLAGLLLEKGKEEEVKEGGTAISAYYKARPKFPYYAKPFVSLGTHTPYVEYQVSDRREKVSLDDIYMHAQSLIEVAEICLSNAYLLKFGRDNDYYESQIGELIRHSLEFRRNSRLERIYDDTQRRF